MKLRINLSLFLILTILFPSLNYDNDYFTLFSELEMIEIIDEMPSVNKESGGGRSNKTIYTLEVYDYSDVLWKLEEGHQGGLYFMPDNISKYATTITGFAISNESIATGFLEYDFLDSHRVIFYPKNIGITEITIYVKDDKGEQGKVMFRFETTPYQKPIPEKIERQYIKKDQGFFMHINSLIKNESDISLQIKDVYSTNPEIALVYLSDSKRQIYVKGLSKGETTVITEVYNMSKLGWNDIVNVSFPVTVTDSVYDR